LLASSVPWWFASSSSFQADLAKRGWAISFVTLASVALADASFDFFFLAQLDQLGTSGPVKCFGIR
jgi:hypothetical protein